MPIVRLGARRGEPLEPTRSGPPSRGLRWSEVQPRAGYVELSRVRGHHPPERRLGPLHSLEHRLRSFERLFGLPQSQRGQAAIFEPREQEHPLEALQLLDCWENLLENRLGSIRLGW